MVPPLLVRPSLWLLELPRGVAGHETRRLLSAMASV